MVPTYLRRIKAVPWSILHLPGEENASEIERMVPTYLRRIKVVPWSILHLASASKSDSLTLIHDCAL
jgi:hypothetical protein